MSKIAIKSIFEQISETVFATRNLDDAKKYILDFVKDKNINEKDKLGMEKAVNESTTLIKLQRYIAMSLLKYEGLGVNQINKTAREAAIDDTNENY